MALLHSLEICGIRSFSPETKETIYFNTPVTLFLGQNGCGKTTIIESIRFALTSELPSGTSNGQGFLNDPKISNKTSTKGSIKIKFLDCQGNEITVSRFMSVTAKAAGGLTFKKMIFNIRQRDKDDPANPRNISGRCLDVDNYCCTALNVSKSILNNVIFCHQENSAWPLDEPKKLKEKFDEIFDAVRYIKCVDMLRKYIKEKQANVKVIQERLAHKKTYKDNAEQKRGKCNERKEKLTRVKEKIEEKESQVSPMEDRMKEILDLEVSLGSLQRKLTGKEAEVKGIVEQQNTIREHISYVFEGTDEELEQKIYSFQAEQESEENLIKDLDKRKQEILSRTTQISKDIQRAQIKIGQLKEEQNQYQKRIQENKDLLEKARDKLQVATSIDLDDSKLIISELENALKQSEEIYDKLDKQNDLEERNLQTDIDEIREKYVSTKQNISSRNSMIEECRNKIRDINYKLDELETSDSQLRTVGESIKKLQLTLSNLKNSFNEAEKLEEIERNKELIQVKETFLEKLDREYRILQQNYVTEQKLESENTAVIEKQGEINRIKSKHLQNFQKLFGNNVPERNFKKSVMEILTREDLKFKTLNDKINKLQKQVTTLEANIRYQREKLESTQRELQNDKKTVAEVCLGRSYTDILNECYTKKEKLQKDKGQYSSAKIMYEAFINKFEKEAPCCPICQTDFSSKKSAVTEIIKKLKNKIERIPTQLLQIDKDLKNEEELYDKLQQLKPVNENIEMLFNVKIPLMEEALNELIQKHEVTSIELATEKNDLLEPQNLIDICKTVITDVPLLDQHLSDIRRATDVISDLKSNIVNVPSKRSRQETEAEIDRVKAELSNLKNQYESHKMMLTSHQERCQRLNTNIQSETQKQIDMQKLVQEKPLLEIQKNEYTEKLAVLRVEVEEFNDKLNKFQIDLTKATEKRSKVVEANKKIKDEEKNKIIENKSIVANIRKIQKSIDLYIQNNNDAKLNQAVADLADLKTKEEKLEEAKNKIIETISGKKQNIAQQQSNFRALRDNETLREKQKLESKLNIEISNLKKLIGDHNFKSVYEEKQRLQKQLDSYRREISSLTGQKQEIIKQINEIEDELERSEFKNAYNNYKKQYYELKVQQLAIEDLSNYVNVLERSVLQFHKERMVQINRTIRELWRNIYRGNDIDYIEIQTDESMTGGVNRRRTYNYKVVQVKKGVELEMRGRCSAGQKVLACLVIRMALAETFSAHCGILALDEPTTNLDKANILSLSDALSRIITVREREKNFQLLIITHDEEFLNTLTRVQSLDSYWKVKRNDNGFSVVQKHFL